MTGSTLHPGYPRGLPWLDDDGITRLWLASALFCGALLIATLPALWFDPRTIDGVPVWMKPVKFQLSLVVHFLTVALLAQLVTRAARTGALFAIASYAAALSMVFEIVYIMIQAGRGRRSHFNYDSQLEALMYAFMGIGAVLLVVAPIILGVMIWRRKDRELSGLRLGASVGLVLSGILTLVVAGYMSNNSSHWVGQTDGDANGVPLFGWNREVGDLRIAHFFSLHLMQALPLLGLIADRIPGLPARPIVWTGTIIGVAIVVAVFLQALAGQPLIR